MTTDQVSASASSPAVEISGLSKSYVTGLLRKRTHKALVGVSLAVPSGEILGYLGPNGSGKTTTLKILMGLIFPDAGSVSLLGLPQHERPWRHRVGYLPENPYLYDYLTPAEYLDYAGRLFGMSGKSRRERSRDLLKLVGLASSMDVPMRRFSKGMLQRAGLAQALINDPELVFLDEPMSGLDPIGRRLVRDILVGVVGSERADDRGNLRAPYSRDRALATQTTFDDRAAAYQRRAGEHPEHGSDRLVITLGPSTTSDS